DRGHPRPDEGRREDRRARRRRGHGARPGDVRELRGEREAAPPVSHSLVIPAFTEEAYLPATLASVQRAEAGIEIIVVDNDSSDRTADVAASYGATIVREHEHNVARVRNAGASAANGDVVVFLDADTLV